MPVFNITDPVSVGLSTKADHYHRAFDNTLALYAGETGIVGAAAGDDPYFSTAAQLSPGQRQLRQTFRGFVSRTHPDADKAAYQCLANCEAAVMNTGSQVEDWSNIVFDVSRAFDPAFPALGGLDTGTEQASTWYQKYLIYKSSDGTKAGLLHRAENYGPDQSFTATQDTGRALRLASATATDKIAQGVQFTTAGPVPFVDLQLNKGGSPTGRIWVTVEADSGGNPSGIALATSDKLDVSLVSSSVQWIRFVFRTPCTISAATQYHLVLQGDYTRSDTNSALWRGVVAGGYANGASKEYNGASWSASSGANGLDRLFRLYVTQNGTALSLPSGYDQYCLVSHVYNNSSSDFVKMQALDRRVWREDVTVFSGFTATVPTLTDLSAYLPPVPVEAFFYSSGSAGDRLAISQVPDGYIAGSASLYAFLPSDSSGRASLVSSAGSVPQAIYAWLINGTLNTTLVLSGYKW